MLVPDNRELEEEINKTFSSRDSAFERLIRHPNLTFVNVDVFTEYVCWVTIRKDVLWEIL